MTEIAIADERRLQSPLSVEELLPIIELARWAPSGDNCQPWRVNILPHGLQVVASGTDQPAFLDFDLEATRIAIGALLENIQLAAKLCNFACDIEYFPSGAPHAWADCRLRRDEQVRVDRLAHFIRDRVSNRRLYQLNSCTEDDFQALQTAVAKVDDVEAELFSSPEQLRTIAEAVALTDRVRMTHRLCHQEFHKKVRWTRAAVQLDSTGFDVATFEIKRHEAWLLRMTRPYALLRLVDFFTGLSQLAASVAAKQVTHSGGVGMLFVAGHDPKTMMNAGRALQRIWLAATSANLAFQVLGVAPLFIRRIEANGRGFTPGQTRAVLAAREKLTSVISVRGRREMPALMFRVGRAAPPSARAGRLSSSEIVNPTALNSARN